MKYRMFQTSQIAVALLLERDGKILVGKRSGDRDFAPDIWELPAGRIEVGETIIQAIKREAKEELGIVITQHRIVDAYQFHRAEIPMLLLTYYCSFKGEISISQEHRELKWVSPSEAIELFAFDLQKDSIRKFVQLR